jgi:hypothetical protein
MNANFAALHESAIDAVDGSSTRHASAMDLGPLGLPRSGGAAQMQTITTIGLDIAKSVFQVHGTDATGQVVIRLFISATGLFSLKAACR